MKIQVSVDVRLCRLVRTYRRFEGGKFLHLKGYATNSEYGDTTSVSIYQSSRSQFLEDFNVLLPPLSFYMRSGGTVPLIRNLATR